ncbi:aldehyde dehydrogenase [Comamonas serinivorans]|uniref:4-(hydroxymethyl)benzenesulfonate dehydrogenase n=1 Tax=Comamonas serinivorans TaxID=1082851 RepID=A0A1Y0EJ98_9BURK|nr:aldehyde dehydrogenase family protein [Comamonas serinivorans]ARU03352.1 aldehyde dehydrogenase [Comamonas serinivorans]
MSHPSFSMTIDGQSTPGEARFPVINPATGQVIADAPDASAAELDQAVASARRAFPAWAATPLAERQRCVAQIGQTLLAQVDVLAPLLMQEQGKPLDQAKQEVQRAAYWCQAMAQMDVPVEETDLGTEVVKVLHVPLGVVGGIVPWNFPVVLALWKVAPALVTGNTLVLKPSPFTPLTTLKLGELLQGVLPPGVLNVISGTDALGPLISSHPGIDKVSFTGSTQTGRKVMESASVNLKRLTLELGGNDAAIVLPDVDVDEVAPKLFWGAFSNNAQFCLAIKRLYIHESIYDRLAAKLVELARQTPMGPGDQPGVQLGPVQNQRQFARLNDLLADTRQQGHRLLCGGEVPEGAGYFFPVTLVDNPPDSARVVKEEPFGPILPLLKFREVDEVVARANDSEYGLGGSVWGRDAQAATDVALRLNTGTVWVNQIHTLGPNKPMAGHKQSGLGVENGLDGLLAYTVPRTVSVKKA